MNTSPVTLHRNLATLGRMLERLETSGRAVNADQFRTLVDRVTAELQSAPHDAGLEAVLAHFPAVAQVYENLNYQHAGLCRSPLESALAAELAARAAIDKARQLASPA
jgi:hypothetical protein